MADKEVVATGGVGVSGLLFVALIILKATGLITMSWFWVITSIIWIPISLILMFFIVIAIVTLIIAAITKLLG